MGKLLTTQEAGKRLGISPLRVRQLILNGRLPASKFGRDWVIQEKDLKKVRDRRPEQASTTSKLDVERCRIFPSLKTEIPNISIM